MSSITPSGCPIARPCLYFRTLQVNSVQQCSFCFASRARPGFWRKSRLEMPLVGKSHVSCRGRSALFPPFTVIVLGWPLVPIG